MTENRMLGTLTLGQDHSPETNTDGALTASAFCNRYSSGRTALYEEINAAQTG